MNAKIIDVINTLDDHQNVIGILAKTIVVHDVPEANGTVTAVQGYLNENPTVIQADNNTLSINDYAGVTGILPKGVIPAIFIVIGNGAKGVTFDLDSTQLAPYQSGGNIFKCKITNHNYILTDEEVQSVNADISGNDVVLGTIVGSYMKNFIIPKLLADDVKEQARLTQTTQEKKKSIDISTLLGSMAISAAAAAAAALLRHFK